MQQLAVHMHCTNTVKPCMTMAVSSISIWNTIWGRLVMSIWTLALKMDPSKILYTLQVV